MSLSDPGSGSAPLAGSDPPARSDSPAGSDRAAGSGRAESSRSTGVQRLAGDPPSPFEARYGFSRVVRTGDWVIVGGTTSISEDGAIIGETPYEQMAEVLGKVGRELARAGADVSQVVQTRVYVTDISQANEVGRAHLEVFGDKPPLMTMVEVSRLIDARMLVEVEAVAYLGAGS